MAQSQLWQRIPTSLTLEQFEEFVLPHLPKGNRGPSAKAVFAHNFQLHPEYFVVCLSPPIPFSPTHKTISKRSAIRCDPLIRKLNRNQILTTQKLKNLPNLPQPLSC
jgi:hypothetical protein